MTNTINRLLAIELIRVEEGKHDRRVKRIYLTEKGSEAREQAISSTMQG